MAAAYDMIGDLHNGTKFTKTRSFKNYSRVIQAVAEYNCICSQIRRLLGILSVPEQMDMQLWHEGSLFGEYIDSRLQQASSVDPKFKVCEETAQKIQDHWNLSKINSLKI